MKQNIFKHHIHYIAFDVFYIMCLTNKENIAYIYVIYEENIYMCVI